MYNKSSLFIIVHADIDECEKGLAGCSYNCNNTMGGFFCTCMNGFTLQTDNRTCAGDN